MEDSTNQSIGCSREKEIREEPLSFNNNKNDARSNQNEGRTESASHDEIILHLSLAMPKR